MPSHQEYANRLREDAHRTLAPQVNELEQEIGNLKNDLALSLGQLGQKLEAIRYFGLPEAESIIEEALEEAAHENDLRLSSLAHYARGIRQKETQEEILNLLLDEAAKVSSRVTLFIAREEQFIGWSSRGFQQRIAEEISSCAFELASPLFQKAIQTETLATATDLADEMSLKFLEESAPGPWHAFPLKAIGRPVALLLAIGAEGRSCQLESLCVLMDLTGLCIENLALKIIQEAQPQAVPPPAPAAEIITPPEPPTAPVQDPEPALAVEESQHQTAQPLLESPLNEEDRSALWGKGAQLLEEIGGQATLDRSSPLEEPAPNSQAPDEPPALEPEAPPQPVPVDDGWANQIIRDTQPAPVPVESVPEPIREFEAAVPPGDVYALAEEERLHSDAKRFARLLVSEIKLYNEQRVMDGRQNRDIYVRLKKDIDKSREMYEKRVPATVSRKIDYFHDEVVRILGENDPSTLGSDYPGPRVES